jgi:hypothetical protein
MAIITHNWAAHDESHELRDRKLKIDHKHLLLPAATVWCETFFKKITKQQ